MTEDALMKTGTVILQNCTFSLEGVPGSCSETSMTSSDNAFEFVSVKVEEDMEMTIKMEEVPEIKSEPEEVRYLSVCLLLDTCHQYPLISSVCHDLHLYICSIK